MDLASGHWTRWTRVAHSTCLVVTGHWTEAEPYIYKSKNWRFVLKLKFKVIITNTVGEIIYTTKHTTCPRDKL